VCLELPLHVAQSIVIVRPVLSGWGCWTSPPSSSCFQ
jgi:hypothetical protein